VPASSRYWSQMPVPAPRFRVCEAQAAGVASKTSDVVTGPSAFFCVRTRNSPRYSTRGLSKLSVVSSGNTPCWLLLPLFPEE